MRRAAKWIGGLVGGLVAIPVLLLLFANTPPGRAVIAWLTPRVTGDSVRLDGLSGRFPDALRAAHVELRDAKGAYATVDDLVLDWSPLRLLQRRIVIDRLDAARISLLRLPVASSGGSTLPPVVLHEVRVARLDVAPELAGAAAAVALEGSGELAGPTAFGGTLAIRALDNSGTYSIAGAADATHLHATVRASEPAQGLLASIVGLPGLGATTLDATLDGPRSAVATRVTLTSGPLHATIGGTVDLEHEAVDLTVTAGAPAMQPRPDIGWQAVSLDAHVRGPFGGPDAAGHLQVDGLTAARTGIARFTADVSGNAGRLRLNGEATGLQLPGPATDLLAADPLLIVADAILDAPGRPVHLMLRHPLFDAEANVRTGDHPTVDASLRLVDLAPFAAIGQIPVRGGVTLNLHATTSGDATTLTADGAIDITGGQEQVQSLVGADGRLDLAASVHGSDVTVSRLQFDGRAGSFAANGTVAANRIDLSWSLAVNDLAAAEPRLGGQLKATGTIAGALDDIGITADIGGNVAAQGMSSGALTAKVEASGLPRHPSGRIVAGGELLGAPVGVAVALRKANDGLAIDIERASWKSFEAGGVLQLRTATMVPVGDLHLAMTRLADLSPLIGRPVAGNVRATLAATPGTTAPSLDARIDAEGLEAAGLAGGTVHASATGTADSLSVKLAAAMADLHGAPARLSAAATLDAVGRMVRVSSLEADWQQQTVRLLGPTRIGFADGVTIDGLRLGMREAVLEASGRAAPVLDLTASLRNLSAASFGAEGTARANARITGSPERPTGKVSLAATELRLRSGAGRALPPAAVTASADLNGTEARIDARITAGGSRIGVTGRAPLSAVGRMDLRASGGLDLALLDPLLGAGGRRVRGHVTLDATLAGPIAAPTIAGSAHLAGGEVQDFTTGLHLRDVAAQIDGSGATLRIAQFSAKAGQGSITGSGSIGVMAPGLPVDLTIAARDATPLASDLITAVTDANLTLRGEALGQLAIGGEIRVKRADIRIPERIPSTIAVLPVNRPGAKPAPPDAVSTVMLNVSLAAPGQVFVRGRGLDVEFGGAMKLAGTMAAPRTVGGLDLRRGGISLAGRSLDFTRGRISFNGGSVTDPSLDLVATSTSGNVTATLAIGGTAHDPKISLTSVPELPQDEVLAHLLFGSGVGRLGVLEVAQIASGLATLTGAGGIGDPLDKVRQGLGLDRLGVTSGANGSPAVEAGRYIAPRVYLGVRQSASGGSQARVQFDLTKRLKLDATAGTGSGSATGAGESNGSGVGLTYQFEY
jgi:translocation and assembly module TamB